MMERVLYRTLNDSHNAVLTGRHFRQLHSGISIGKSVVNDGRGNTSTVTG